MCECATHPLVAILSVGFLLASAPACAADAAKPMRVGAKVVKRVLAMAETPARVVVLDHPADWALLEGEKYTGENAREYFFTLEAKAQVEPPRVEVRWPGVDVERVLGAAGQVEKVEGGVRFRIHSGLAPTGVRTGFWVGRNVHMVIQHNWDARRAGPYRKGPWPAKAIQSQLNYLFAAREAAKAMGLADAADPGFIGDVRLYGFETNFPNGHVDHPPHFHIMLGWPGWLGTQATHFRLDADGLIDHNSWQMDDGKKLKSHTYSRGEVCPCRDREGKVGFELTVAGDGTGVIWRWPKSSDEYLLRAEPESGSAVNGVQVARRRAPDAMWEQVCLVRAEDAADRGEMRIVVRPVNGPEQVEVMRYDRDTGRLLPQ